ncbi:hypothetical protein [Methanosphaera sp. WGK6]|uniref:hypothetical protein n=1 Tax=Methanosphaera sp. WGK6 TaxID=1561964 RepID=UPI00084C62D9|nr:hypothetical protein [Methanosphaera sp. WGK6]OED30326.1 hypothetical protein NL43_02805 [Methanosphaera sp. WGK6]
MPPKYDLHLEIYTNHYKKLEKKGIIILDLEPENGLPYDMKFTNKGLDIINEITTLEKEWEDKVLDNVEDKEELLKLLQDMSLKAIGISYTIQKQVKGVY